MSKAKHPQIPLKPVQSSQIAEYGYDEASKTLAVKFHNGGVYHYHGVTDASVAAFEAAESKGKYVATHIRNRHDFVKIS